MVFVCMDLDETLFSSENNIRQFRILNLISSDQYYHLDHVALSINGENIISRQRKEIAAIKVKFFYPKKHLNFLSKASQATGSGFCLFFITNGLYSKKSFNEMIKLACSIHKIAPPSELFNVYNRIDLFGRSSHELDPHRIAQAKLQSMIKEFSIQYGIYKNSHEEHSFFFVDDRDATRKLIADSLDAITIDPKDRNYCESIEMLTGLAEDAISKKVFLHAKSIQSDNLI